MNDGRPDHTMFLFGLVCQRLHPEFITIWAKANNHSGGNRGQIGMVPERLAGVHVGNMHFNRWSESAGNRIG